MKKKQATLAALACAVFAMDGLAIAACMVQSHSAGQRLENRHNLVEHLENIASVAQSLGPLARTYINNPDHTKLAAYYAGETRLGDLLAQLPPLARQNGDTSLDLVALHEALKHRIDWEHQLFDANTSGGKSKAIELINSGGGAASMQDVRQLVNEMVASELIILQKDTIEHEFYRNGLLTAIIFLTLAGAAALWQAIKHSSLSLNLQAERVRSNVQLQQLNDQLNKQLAELVSMQEQKEKALLIRSQFLARITHELRTPLAGIIGSTALALEGPLEDEEHKLVELANRTGHEMLALVDDILDFESLQKHDLKLEHERFDLPLAIQSALDPFIVRAEQKGLILTVTIAKNISPFVFGDRVRLQQILTNLVDNAVKFTKGGTVNVAVIVEESKALHETLRFTISDTGIGIEPDMLSEIWEPFMQADGTTTRSYGGSGLGLSIAKKLVELHQGKIGAASLPGKGSEFYFRLSLDLPPDNNGSGITEDANKQIRELTKK